jgi:hypothetical protein
MLRAGGRQAPFSFARRTQREDDGGDHNDQDEEFNEHVGILG